MLCQSKLTSILLPILSSLTHLASASPLLTNNLQARDEWQTNPSTLNCLYFTNEPNWAGEGINLCEVGGTCGQYTSLPHSSLTHSSAYQPLNKC